MGLLNYENAELGLKEYLTEVIRQGLMTEGYVIKSSGANYKIVIERGSTGESFKLSVVACRLVSAKLSNIGKFNEEYYKTASVTKEENKNVVDEGFFIGIDRKSVV